MLKTKLYQRLLCVLLSLLLMPLNFAAPIFAAAATGLQATTGNDYISDVNVTVAAGVPNVTITSGSKHIRDDGKPALMCYLLAKQSQWDAMVDMSTSTLNSLPPDVDVSMYDGLHLAAATFLWHKYLINGTMTKIMALDHYAIGASSMAPSSTQQVALDINEGNAGPLESGTDYCLLAWSETSDAVGDADRSLYVVDSITLDANGNYTGNGSVN